MSLQRALKKENLKKEEEKLTEDSKITTYNGKVAKFGDCHNIGGHFYPKNDPVVVIDIITKALIDKTRSATICNGLDKHGLPDLNNLAYTRVSNWMRHTVTVYFNKSRDPINFINHNLLLDAGYVECLETGTFFHPSLRSLAKSTKTGRYRKINATKKFSKTDNIHNQRYGLDSSTYSITEGKRYTMGFELETCKGYLPIYVDDLLNYEAVHDGSLREADGSAPHGGEYVTGVLKGDMGFRQLKLLCNELNKRCKIDKRCGVHFHIGNVDFNKEFVVYMYYLCRKLEDELFSLLPHSRRNNEYCRKLKGIPIDITRNFKTSSDYQDYIEDIYGRIVLYVSHQDKLDSTILNKQNNHPLGDKCGYNHNTARYSWLNLVPTLFNTRENEIYTLEFRPMQGSLNYMKIRNMALIYMALVYVVENHKTYLSSNKTITLNDIIRLAYPKKADELIKFMDCRKMKFSTKESSELEEKNEYNEESIDNSTNLRNL